MTTLTVQKFISKSGSYIRREVQKANTNKNPYLTKAEAKKLPKDLKDNFENYRMRAQDNRVVTAKKIEKGYVRYVATGAYNADRNDNGLLSYAEAKSLPKDLKDNYANYRAWVERNERKGPGAA